MILVGDSMGMCVYGYSAGTLPVTMDQCIVHTEAVRRGAPNTLVGRYAVLVLSVHSGRGR